MWCWGSYLTSKRLPIWKLGILRALCSLCGCEDLWGLRTYSALHKLLLLLSVLLLSIKIMSLCHGNAFPNAYHLLLMTVKMIWEAQGLPLPWFHTVAIATWLLYGPPFLFKVSLGQFKPLYSLFIKLYSSVKFYVPMENIFSIENILSIASP